MADIFGDAPPQDMVRASKGWLKQKKGGVRSHMSSLRKENLNLKSRLKQLEAAVAEIVSKKGKK